MSDKQEFVLTGSENRPFPVDVRFARETAAPLLVFAHGFKGYKDWGHWNAIADWFNQRGCHFLKFNFSHNGGTVENPIDFPDLEAFGNNRYSYEVADLNQVLDHIGDHLSELRCNATVVLIGHSRGGGIATICAKHTIVSGLVTWASVSSFLGRLPDNSALDQWEKDGVTYIINGRTKQKMPMNYSFVEDLVSNQESLNILDAAGSLKKPALVIHGSADEAVSPIDGEVLADALECDFIEIEEAGHTFGGRHPWEETSLPVHTIELLEATMGLVRTGVQD